MIHRWRRLCLPSSNGAFTCRAVGRIFGALANGGAVQSRPKDDDDDDSGSGNTKKGQKNAKKPGAKAGGRSAKNGNDSTVAEEEEDRFASAAAVAALVARVTESAYVSKKEALPCRHPDGQFPNDRARMSCGFFPW